MRRVGGRELLVGLGGEIGEGMGMGMWGGRDVVICNDRRTYLPPLLVPFCDKRRLSFGPAWMDGWMNLWIYDTIFSLSPHCDGVRHGLHDVVHMLST